MPTVEIVSDMWWNGRKRDASGRRRELCVVAVFPNGFVLIGDVVSRGSRMRVQEHMTGVAFEDVRHEWLIFACIL